MIGAHTHNGITGSVTFAIETKIKHNTVSRKIRSNVNDLVPEFLFVKLVPIEDGALPGRHRTSSGGAGEEAVCT